MQKNIYSLAILVLATSCTTFAQPSSAEEHSYKNFQDIIELASTEPYLARFTAKSHPVISYVLDIIRSENSSSITQDQNELYASCQTNEFMPLTSILTVLRDIKGYLENLTTRAERVSDNPNPPVGNNQFLSTIIRVIEIMDESLDDCCDEILAAITSLTNIITMDFQNTWTILASILNTQTTCCNDTFTVLANLKTTITNDFLATWTILEACSMTPIFTPTTITLPGTYCLSNDITGPIIIAASNVTLDLNHNSISQTTNGIIINSLQTNIFVKNGTISSTTLEGILVQQGAREVTLLNIDLINCGSPATPFAVLLQGVTATPIINCIIDNVNVYNSPSGIVLENTNACLVQNCLVSSCGNIPLVTGFGVLGTSISATASANQFIDCIVEDCTATSTMAGFLFQNAADTVCKNCLVDNVQALNVTGGIRIMSSYNTFISDTIINSVAITSTVNQNLFIIFADSAYYCAGIEINGSAANTLKNITMSNIGSTSTIVQDNFGIYFGALTLITPATRSPDLIAENISINTINETFAHSVGIGSSFSTTPGAVFLNNCTINNVLGQAFASGVTLSISDVALIKNSSVMNTNASGPLVGETQGFSIQNAVSSICTVLIDNCQVSFLAGEIEAIGFNITGTANAIINNCLVNTITATNGSIPNPVSIGFAVTGPHSLINNCIADQITSPIAGMSIGFQSLNGCSLSYCQALNYSSGSGILISTTGALVNGCVATNAILTGSSIGINNTAGAGVKIVNCTAYNNATNYSGTLPAPGTALAPGSATVMGANLTL